jgi:hypothetical protein
MVSTPITLLISLIYLISLVAHSAAAGDDTASGKKERVCMLVPDLPWNFGPYQDQSRLLSSEFAEAGYDVYWIPVKYHMEIPIGTYTAAELMIAMRKPPVPSEFPVDHLTFAGLGRQDIIGGNSVLTTSALNKHAKTYGCDMFFSLMDIVSVFRDGDFDVPFTAWIPYHYKKLTPGDAYLLRSFSGIASLAPTMASTMLEQLEGFNSSAPAPVVEFIPHIMPASLADNSANDKRDATRSKLGLEKDTFVVLMQGGNYDNLDRKGWSNSIQAFANFYKRQELLTGGPPNVHLYIHAISSITISARERMAIPPKNAMSKGIQLQQLIDAVGIPSSSYTLDGTIHPWELHFEMKAMADVCLHATKTEGFGLNYIECQGLGTPVITTDFSAMSDYTKLGKAVTPVQFEWMVGGFAATPHVPGIEQALMDLKAGELNTGAEQTQATRDWVQTDFSVELVSSKMLNLLKASKARHESMTAYTNSPEGLARKKVMIVTEDLPLAVNWDTPYTLALPPAANISVERLENVISEMMSNFPAEKRFICPIVYADAAGNALPVTLPGTQQEFDTSVPLLMNTHVYEFMRSMVSIREKMAATATAVIPSNRLLMIPAQFQVAMRKENAMLEEL